MKHLSATSFRLFERCGISRAPVVGSDKVIGIVSDCLLVHSSIDLD